MHVPHHPTVAVIGAGIAGLSCAMELAAAGFTVSLFDKSLRPGGRLASRAVEWVQPHGAVDHMLLDHGAPWFAARDPSFQHLLRDAERAGAVARWRPRIHADGLAHPADELHVGTPSMAALGHFLLTRAALGAKGALHRHFGQQVTAVHRSAAGWRLEWAPAADRADAAAKSARTPVDTPADITAGAALPGQSAAAKLSPVFQHLVIALPAPQAATLLTPHQVGWARSLNESRMEAGWTLLGITDEPPWPWDAAVPLRGPLALLVREDRKPGRSSPPACAAWVAQADPAWAAAFANAPATQVAAHLQAAVNTLCPQPGGLRWHHLSVHRWRCAQPATRDGRHGTAPTPQWDAALGVGVCGDNQGAARGGGASCVEAAWLSGRALGQAILGQHTATSIAARSTAQRPGVKARLEAVPG